MKIKKKGENVLSKGSVKEFREDVLPALRERGRCAGCPVWLEDRYDLLANCAACHQAFPKEGKYCPCNSGYSKEYLVKRVREIIKTGRI